jgi:hypothetical protein
MTRQPQPWLYSSTLTFESNVVYSVQAGSCKAHEWWEMIAGGTAELRKVAMRVLSKTSSALTCERNWSAFAAVQTPKHTRLTSEHLDNLVYLRTNVRLQRNCTDSSFTERVAQWIDSSALDDDSEAVVYSATVSAAATPQDVVVIDAQTIRCIYLRSFYKFTYQLIFYIPIVSCYTCVKTIFHKLPRWTYTAVRRCDFLCY